MGTQRGSEAGRAMAIREDVIWSEPAERARLAGCRHDLGLGATLGSRWIESQKASATSSRCVIDAGERR